MTTTELLQAAALAVASNAALDLAKAPIVSTITRLLTSNSKKIEIELEKQEANQDVAQAVADFARIELAALVESVDSSGVQSRFDAAASESKPSLVDAANLTERTAKMVEKSTNIRKRKLLAAALVNSFDPVLYSVGDSEEVIEILDRLSPSDVRTLEACKARLSIGQEKMATSHYTSAIKLLELRLIINSRSGRSEIGEGSHLRITSLGQSVLDHIAGHNAWPLEEG